MVLVAFYLNVINVMIIIVSISYSTSKDPNANSTYVHIFEERRSFLEAKELCTQNSDFYLVTVSNKNDTDKLVELLIKNNISSSWIGSTYLRHESKKSKVGSSKKSFAKGDKNASDCLVMNRNNDGNYTCTETNCSSRHSFICMKTNSSSDLLPHALHYIKQCPQPFFQVDGDCFWMSQKLMMWNEAREVCRNKSIESDLASIRTDFQKDYFSALISGLSTGFWIGLNFSNNQYQWILQKDLQIIRWGENQPKESSKKNCTFISNNEDKLGNLYTAYCSDKFNAICQTLKKSNATFVNENTNTPDLTYDDVLFKKGRCQKPGYYYYHDSCYRLYNDRQLSYNDAVNFCNNQTFKNETGYTFLVDLISLPSAGEKKFILADLKRFANQNSTVWLNIRENMTETKDGSFGQMNTLHSLKRVKHLCFRLSLNGVVNSSDCDEHSKETAMCKYQLKYFNSKSLNANRLNASCPKKWTLFNSFCYFFESKIYQSYFAAKKACLKLNSGLVFIDMHHQKFISDFIKKRMYSSKSQYVWIGLEASNTSSGRLHFNWWNEFPVSYLNLESINVVGKKKKWCSVFVSAIGLWRLTNCTNVNANVLCQQPADITKISNNALKPGFVLINDLLSWKDAKEKCKGLSRNGLIGTLATINSHMELLKIRHIKRDLRKQRFWIGLSGLYDHFDNIFLKWSDGSKLVFQNYDHDNLMTLTGTENCVMMDMNSGKWLASECYIKRPSVCHLAGKKIKANVKENQKPHPLPEPHWPGPRFCPPGFHEYSHKCYMVIENQRMNFEKADNHCRGLIPSEYQPVASLASIDSRFENSFVYSLLSSSLHNTSDTRYWIGERYSITSSKKYLCAGISSHPDPYIGARWFATDCLKEMKFICSSLKIPIKKQILPKFLCRAYHVQYNNSLGIYCYHFEDLPNTWKDAKVRCTFQNSSSLLSLPTHFHLHFLLSQYEKQGWSRDNPIWLGSEIEQSQKLTHWQWHNGGDVRYTLWNKKPNLNEKNGGTLCLYLFQEQNKDRKFGVQIDECSKLTSYGYIVCEYSISNGAQTKMAKPNKNCLSNSRSDAYEGNVNSTVNGLRCVRWDLLRDSRQITHSLRNDRVKHNYLQYHSNECRYIHDKRYSTAVCGVTVDKVNESILFKECGIPSCVHKILHHKEEMLTNEHQSNVMTVIIVTLILLICVIACIALLSWRRWNKTSLFGGYLRRGQFSMLSSQARGTSFNNPIYSPVNC